MNYRVFMLCFRSSICKNTGRGEIANQPPTMSGTRLGPPSCGARSRNASRNSIKRRTSA